MVELIWGNCSAWARPAPNAGCCRLTLESCRFSRERPGQVLALSSTCRAGQESHPSRAKSDQTPGPHSGKGRLQTGLRGSRGWGLREERELLCRLEPTKAFHIQSKEAGMLGWVLLADLPGPSSGVKCSRALPIHSSFPSPYSPGHWACQTRAPPLFELTPVPSAPYAQCDVTKERLLGTPIKSTIKSGCFKLEDGLMHPWARLCQVCSDLEGGMVPPACLNSSLCGTQSFPTMRNHAAQRLASLAGTQGGAGAGGGGSQ